MKKKFCMLSILDATALQSARIRSLISGMIYVEIGHHFIISCSKSFKDPFSRQLDEEHIAYIMVFVNLKNGCDVDSWGINDSDKAKIESIVMEP